MPLFVCAKCKCVENTALGLWWNKHDYDIYVFNETNETFKGKGLCSECAPEKFVDGTLTKYGKWHDQFEKENYIDSGITEKELMQYPAFNRR